MPISISCSCGKQLNLADDLAGAKIRCPACQGALIVPAAAAPGDYYLLAEPALPKDKLRSQEDMWDETDERIRTRHHKHETSRSTTRLYVYAGAAVLGLVSCLGCGIGGWQ